MLQLMRKKAQSWMIKVIFAVIIVVFVFFYGYSRRTGSRRLVAEVNGVKIDQEVFRNEYQRAYQNLVRLYRSIYKDKFDETMIDQLGLRNKVLNDLIDETLMIQQARRLSLQVGPGELQAAVRTDPAFQVDGQFNAQRFRTLLQLNQISVDEFEEIEERKLLIGKLVDMIGLGGAEVSDQEVLDTYALENEKINLKFVRLNAVDYEDAVSVDRSEMENYYAEHNPLFETPPKIQVEFIAFAPDDFLGEVEVSSEEIREEYELNSEEYRIPKRVKVSHILIKPELGEEEESREEARKKAEEVLGQAKDGGDFETLARQYSMDAESAEQGGSVGWFVEGENVAEFVEAAFSLEEGAIGPLVESEDGFHIVKVDEVQKARLKSFDEVTEEIRSEIAREKSRQMAMQEAEGAFFETFEAKNLEQYAAEAGKALQTTPLFSRNEKVESVGGKLEFNREAFSLAEGEVSPPLEIGGAFYLMKVVRKEPSRIPPFEEVTDDVRKAVVREKAKEHAEVLADELLAEAVQGGSLEKPAEKKGLQVTETGFFERGGTYVPKLGPAQRFGAEVFSLSSENPLLDSVVDHGNAFLVIELKEEQKIDMEEFESVKEEYRQRLLAEKRARILQQWLARVREESDIDVRPENLGV